MLDQREFGKRVKLFREKTRLTQKELAMKLGISDRAISKWENGICLPDAYHLKLLAIVLKTSADCLLDMERENIEKVVQTIKVGEAVFELVDKPGMILAGKIIHAKDYVNINDFHAAIDAFAGHNEQAVYHLLTDGVLPINDIHLSVNFWCDESVRAYGFVREVRSERQPEGVDVYRLPASMYLRAYTDRATAQLLAKEQCETWELFAYIRDYIMPSNKLKMAENGAQELEVFDTSDHTTGYAYLPVSSL